MFSGFDPNLMTTQDMMAGHHVGEEDQFFDARDEIASVSDLGFDCSEDCCSGSGLPNCVVNSIGYDFWVKTPESAYKRRRRLLKWMGLISNQNQVEKEESSCILCDKIKMGIDRISEDSGSVPRNSNLDDRFLSSRSSVSRYSIEEAEFLEDNTSEENFVCKINNLDDGKQFVIDGVRINGLPSRLREVGSNSMTTIEEFQRIFSSSSQRSLCGGAEAHNLGEVKRKLKSGWLRKLSIIGHIVGRQGKTKLRPSSFNSEVGARIPRVQVHTRRKRSKELSSLYMEQEFASHVGSILTMKFSPDGQYLASAGEDGIVRVWKVIEDEKPNKLDGQHIDPSCLYLSANHVSKLMSLGVNKDKISKTKRLKKSSEPACVIFPSKVFQIIEEPLHEFHGHGGEVLALSWSKNGCLLSSSVDKTVRLWQIGHNQCLRVFSHNNYVTCVEFNPVDNNYFISGSIDGKVRIWEVHACRVVDWIDIREIVTAVCYFPHGKGGIVGSMDGSCRFYSIIDNQLQLDAQICLQGKKKLPCKRITGFQFSPNDPSKVLVTCADSQVQILCGVDVIFKFKGPRISGSRTTAFFTADGKHIVSTSENSNVHVWDYNSQDTTSRPKKIWSCESFASYNASIAIPWCGMKTMSGSPLTPSMGDDDLAGCNFGNGQLDQDLQNSTTTSSSRDCFSLSRRRLHLSEPSPKGTATWPEDKLPNSSPMVVSPAMSRSEYKILKSVCHNMWGLVIVTAGWDGRIRTYHNYGLPVRL